MLIQIKSRRWCLVSISMRFTCFSFLQMLPPGDWHCPNCTCKFCKTGSIITEEGEGAVDKLLWCSLCEKKCKAVLLLEVWSLDIFYTWADLLNFHFADHKSCSLDMNALPSSSNNSSVSFCGQKCQEVFLFSCLLYIILRITKQIIKLHFSLFCVANPNGANCHLPSYQTNDIWHKLLSMCWKCNHDHPSFKTLRTELVTVITCLAFSLLPKKLSWRAKMFSSTLSACCMV